MDTARDQVSDFIKVLGRYLYDYIIRSGDGISRIDSRYRAQRLNHIPGLAGRRLDHYVSSGGHVESAWLIGDATLNYVARLSHSKKRFLGCQLMPVWSRIKRSVEQEQCPHCQDRRVAYDSQ